MRRMPHDRPSTSPCPEEHPVNDKAYIHEFIDIRDTHRADYMHHMTANWSPNAQEDRAQLCFGVWAVVGSTGTWPQVVNIWEEDGLSGIARSLSGELVGPALQDPKLAKWWAEASKFRRGGVDRILLPAADMPTISETLAAGVRAPLCAQEILRCRPGSAQAVLDLATELAIRAYDDLGWIRVGAWKVAMRDDDEVILMWAIGDHASWAAGEAAQSTHAGLLAWRRAARAHVTDWQRILLAGSALNPLGTGRQPVRSDRIDWEE